MLTEPGLVIAAGQHYPQLWLRDAAVNAWNAGSFQTPIAAEGGLLEVAEKRGERYVLPHPDYYDGVIWITGAWIHACVTGSVEFLHQALAISRDVLAKFRAEEFEGSTGLYRGGSFFNDGVSAYPDYYAAPSGPWGNILDCLADESKRASRGGGLQMHCLSTNCLHLLSLKAGAAMAEEVGLPGNSIGGLWTEQAEALRHAIRTHFWEAATSRLSYLTDACGKNERQELNGWAFACLAGVLTPDEQSALAAQLQRLSYGPPQPLAHLYTLRQCGRAWPAQICGR